MPVELIYKHYIVIPEGTLYLCPVMLSQKTTPPSCGRVMTQVCASPLDLVPMHTYASKPNPRSRLQRR